MKVIVGCCCCSSSCYFGLLILLLVSVVETGDVEGFDVALVAFDVIEATGFATFAVTHPKGSAHWWKLMPFQT